MRVPLKIKKLCLAIALANLNVQYAFALEALDDETLGATTGEGIAFLPENYSLSMNGANPMTGLHTDNSGAGTYGSGYMRFIPVGPLSATATGKGYQKAEVYLYGLSLGQSKKDYNVTIDSSDWGVPFGAIGTGATDFGRGITSWGTAANPWLLKTVTEANVPNFVGNTSNSVTYLGLEAPLYHAGATPIINAVSSLSVAEQSAYNLKMGYWTDLAMRDSTVAESGYAGLSNRLRLAFAWDGFSVNGSNLKVFQTLGGVTPAMGGTYTALLKINGVPNVPKTFNYGLSTSYNQTLGIAGLARINSRPTDTVRATVSLGSITREIIKLDYLPVRNYNTVTNTRAGQFIENGVLATNTVASGVGTMSAATANATNVAPTFTSGNDAANNAAAHAIGLDITYNPMTNGGLRGPTTDPDAGQAPLLDSVTPYPLSSHPYKYAYEYAGVAGSFVDGGVCSSPTDNNRSTNNQFGQCLTQEGFTTRRFKARSSGDTWTPPAAKSVFRMSTQELLGGAFGTGTPALGGGVGLGEVPNFRPNASTEGIYFYDMNINLVLGNLYQPLMLSTDGTNFSFELARIPNNVNVYSKIYTRYAGDTGDGSVTYLGSTCNIHQCGTGVSYGGVNYQGSTATHSSISIGSTVYNATTNELQASRGSDSYGVTFGEAVTASGSTSEVYVDYTQVWNRTRNVRIPTSSSCWVHPCYAGSWPVWGSNTNPAADDEYQLPDGSNFTAHGWQKVAPKAAYTSPAHPSLNRPDPYETTMRQNYNNQVLGIHTTMPTNMATTLNNMMPVGTSAANNFGSAVIDGLLIQHLKFSTTGL